jgi:hypothetical protein
MKGLPGRQFDRATERFPLLRPARSTSFGLQATVAPFITSLTATTTTERITNRYLHFPPLHYKGGGGGDELGRSLVNAHQHPHNGRVFLRRCCHSLATDSCFVTKGGWMLLKLPCPVAIRKKQMPLSVADELFRFPHFDIQCYIFL